MVWTGLFPAEGGDYSELREALDKLRLSDAALVYEPETSQALGFGFRVGFLGLLHMDIVRERLEREFDLELIATAPNVEYHVIKDGGHEVVHNPAEMPTPGLYDAVEEPYVDATIITPAEYLGAVMELCQARRGEMMEMQYLSTERVEVHYILPLAEIVFDFFDQLKSGTRGYASLDYEPWGFGAAELVRVESLLHGEPVDAFSTVVHRDKAYQYGKRMMERLKELIPRQLFEVAIQAAIGAKVIARETVRAKRKDVLAKCYGGDITRKRKLLEKQKKGKARMRRVGRVDVPQEAFISALRVDESRRRGRSERRRANVDGQPAGIYVHVPFCLTRCGYCDFNAYAELDHLKPRYLTGLLEEASLAAPGWESTPLRQRVHGRRHADHDAPRRPAFAADAPAGSLRSGGGRRGHDRGEPRHRRRRRAARAAGGGLRPALDGCAIVRSCVLASLERVHRPARCGPHSRAARAAAT